ncbi:hypothetical protein DBV15_05101 [Temnothorax longispinosus]|uniref:Uncharacterized protein n=1 Tax=Temnothorax longispinosus TaxID=300112 RepID=A0A4S2KYN1_9HYME|nr:hypothetical protein DBV15_05101 [Temnothorax longispinosus]
MTSFQDNVDCWKIKTDNIGHSCITYNLVHRVRTNISMFHVVGMVLSDDFSLLESCEAVELPQNVCRPPASSRLLQIIRIGSMESLAEYQMKDLGQRVVQTTLVMLATRLRVYAVASEYAPRLKNDVQRSPSAATQSQTQPPVPRSGQVHSSMNTTSKASNAFEAFFGIHELPPPPSPPTSPLPLLPMPPPSPLPPLLLLLPLPLPRVLASTLKARKLHWRNPTANIGIDIIGVQISQQRHGEHNTDDGGEGSRKTHT